MMNSLSKYQGSLQTPSAMGQVCFLEMMRGWGVALDAGHVASAGSTRAAGSMGGRGSAVGGKSFHGHSQHADVTNNHPSKVAPHTQKREGIKEGMGITYDFCDMAKKTISLRRGKTGCSWNRSFIYKMY